MIWYWQWMWGFLGRLNMMGKVGIKLDNKIPSNQEVKRDLSTLNALILELFLRECS